MLTLGGLITLVVGQAGLRYGIAAAVGFGLVTGTGIEVAAKQIGSRDQTKATDAAADVGFTERGFLHEDMAAVRDRFGFADMHRLVDTNGIRHCEFEMSAGCWATGEKRARSGPECRDHPEAGHALRARNVKVACEFGATEIDIPPMHGEFLECVARHRHVARELRWSRCRLEMSLTMRLRIRLLTEPKSLIPNC
ncbi:hypothetical protein [Shimia sp.]|uniref:hypothetical protein n=1 Tax=Shimia sp. TaxID=1954381 RepID=UPI0032968918